MKKQQIITIVDDDGNSEVIQCYIQKSGVFKAKGRNTWSGRKMIKGESKWFNSDALDMEDAHRDINKQCHVFKNGGKRTVIKRNEYPSLL